MAPFVVHDPGLDLFVQCLKQRDVARDKGTKDAKLCYGSEPRRQLGTLRIEHAKGLTVAKAIKHIRDGEEAAHFAIEPSGTTHQILDLAYAPMRGGELRAGEIRVLSGNREAHERLQRAIQAHFPRIRVEVVDVDTLGDTQ